MAAGTDAGLVESSAIDCASYDRMMVIFRLGATATNAGKLTMYIEDCTTPNGTFEELSGSKKEHTFGSSGETNKFHIIDVALAKKIQQSLLSARITE